jgi:hypothetical protein
MSESVTDLIDRLQSALSYSDPVTGYALGMEAANEIGWLTRECERFVTELREWKDRLRAVVERTNLAHDLHEEALGKSQAEIERLRSALQKIAEDDYLPNNPLACEVARRALEGKDG